MAIKKLKESLYVVDAHKDMRAIEDISLGASCYVVKDACLYRQLSNGEWIKQGGSNFSNHVEFDISNSNSTSNVDKDVDLTGYATEEYVNHKIEKINLSEYAKTIEVNEQIAKINVPSIEGLATKENVEEIASNPILKAFDFSRNTSKEDAQAIYLKKENSTTLIEALREKGLGLYNIWMEKGRTDLPQTMIADNTSGRGFACVDLQMEADPNDFIGYIVLFDKNNSMYYQFISHGVAGPWMKVNAEEA